MRTFPSTYEAPPTVSLRGFEARAVTGPRLLVVAKPTPHMPIRNGRENLETFWPTSRDADCLHFLHDQVLTPACFSELRRRCLCRFLPHRYMEGRRYLQTRDYIPKTSTGANEREKA